MSTDIRLIYVTTRDVAEARRLARALLEEKLIACANILPQMESIYVWEGAHCEESEVVLILKTTVTKTSRAIARVEELHSYETPCALSLAVENGAENYLQWLGQQVHPSTDA